MSHALRTVVEPPAEEGTSRPRSAASSEFPALLADEEIDALAARAEPQDQPPVRYEPLPIVEKRFPRIAETIRVLWGTAQLEGYFRKLVVDERGDRDGFPPEVLAALLALASAHGERHRFPRAECVWVTEPARIRR